jgi:UDP-glucose 4-epimerase
MRWATRMVVQAAKRAGTRRFIYFQTALCYGAHPLEQPITLTHPIRPESSYSISKTAGEQYIELSGLEFLLVPAGERLRAAGT